MSSGGLYQGRSVSGGLAYRHRQPGGGQVSLAGMGDRGRWRERVLGTGYKRGFRVARRVADRSVGTDGVDGELNGGNVVELGDHLGLDRLLQRVNVVSHRGNLEGRAAITRPDPHTPLRRQSRDVNAHPLRRVVDEQTRILQHISAEEVDVLEVV